MRSKTVIFLVGPTASGKSELAVALAKKIGGEIISADSMLVYKGMDIGTAKPSRQERLGVPHHGIDLIPQSKNYSVFSYRRYALKTIKGVLKRGKTPIIAGGTGFYVRALLEGLSPHPGANPAIRRKLDAEAQRKGLAALYSRLSRVDPVRAKEIGPHNQRRIVRALEIHEVSGKKASSASRKSQGLRALGYEPVVIGIHRDRQALYERINKRVERMFRNGLVPEVKRLMRRKFSLTALQGVGYKEVVECLKKGTDADFKKYRGLPPAVLKEAVAKIQQTTRRFAKRQWTWFKRETGIRWVWWPEGARVADIARFIQRMIGGTK